MQTRISDKKKPARHLLLAIMAQSTEQQSGWSAIYFRLLNQIPQFTLSPRRMSRLQVLAAF